MERSRHMRIRSKGRFTMFITIMIIMAVAVIFTAAGFSDVRGDSEDSYINVSVVSGDTLWTISDEYMPSDMDKREAIYEIKSANNMKTSELTPGQTIRIPVSE